MGHLKILGIDPGSRITGYGLIEASGSGFRFLEAGCIRASGELPERLLKLYRELREIALEFRPKAVAVEEVFVGRNARSALILGQARGAALCALLDLPGIELHQYPPSLVKEAVTGSGSAPKEQVRYMVQQLLSLKDPLPLDASDALAVALCHLHHRSLR